MHFQPQMPGGKESVEGVFQTARGRFNLVRKDGARPLRGLEKKPDRLYNLLELQTNVFG